MTGLDFAYVGAHFLWVLGLSMILAGVSYHVWVSQETGRRLASEFRTPSWLLTLNIGLALVLLSITVMPRSERWFVRLAALLLAMTCTGVGVSRWIRRSLR